MSKSVKATASVEYQRERGGPVVRAELSIDVDVQDIVRRIGKRAAMSKGGKAIECGGAIVVKVLSRQEVK